MSILASYSPEDITILVGGVYAITGYVDGTFISVSKDVQAFSTRESSDGVVSRSHSNSRLHTLTLSLHSASESNQVLTHLMNLDVATKIAKFPILVKDKLGQSIMFAPSCWVELPSDMAFSTGIMERDWTIKCSEVVMNSGGNYDASSTGEDILNLVGGVIGDILLR